MLLLVIVAHVMARLRERILEIAAKSLKSISSLVSCNDLGNTLPILWELVQSIWTQKAWNTS